MNWDNYPGLKGYIELTQYKWFNMCRSWETDESKLNYSVVIHGIGWETIRVNKHDNVLNWVEGWPIGFWPRSHGKGKWNMKWTPGQAGVVH